jgi:hypothetical protein
MQDQLRYLIIGTSLVLGACELEADELELEQLEQPELGQPTAAGAVDDVGVAPSGDLRSLAGVDQDCVDVNGPIIMRIDPLTTTCEFNGFVNFESKWKPASLFEEGSPMLAGLSVVLPTQSPLRQFCRYEYTGTESQRDTSYTAFLSYLRGPNAPAGVDGDAAAVDCPVVAPMTDEGLDTSGARQALHDAFMANIHAVPAEDLPMEDRSEMRLVLLDTVAEGFTPYNEHGLYLAALFADIACPGATNICRHWTRQVLVTPRLSEDDYRTAEWRGGSVGYMHEFSMGLAFGLLDWSKDNLPLPIVDRTRLVMSAAVGADPNHPIASDPAFAPAQSAIVALQAAYCMGATVYAAAGNTRDNSCPNEEEHMLAPASYEDIDVPTQAECVSWGYVADYPADTFEPGSPLIHAVGGLDGKDRSIPNHRRDAQPGLHATASNAISEAGTVAITGTSVATVVAASAHLMMWSFEPEMSGALVAEHLYDTAYPTGEFANSGIYASAPIRRLGICQALEDQLGLVCDDPAPDPDGYLDEYLLATEDAIEVADLADLLVGPYEAKGLPADCSVGPVFDTFIHPQPERPACASCSGTLNGGNGGGDNHMLNMSIANESWTVDLDVTAAYLHTYDAAGNATTFNLSAVVPSINQAISANVIQVSFQTPTPASAVLEFVYYDSVNYVYTKQANSIPLL